MPHRSRSLRARTTVVVTGVLTTLLLPVAASAAPPDEVIQPLRDRLGTAADAEYAPERREVPPSIGRAARQQVTAAAAAGTPSDGPVKIAVVQGVELYSPSPETMAVGFHEGATRSLPLDPVFNAPEGAPEPVVMGSRGRGTGATSAIDIAVPRDTPLRSPVTGEVVEANEYALYGSTRDHLVTVAPEGAPDLRVRMFHLEGVRVQIGDEVVAGETVLADRSRVLPFSSQIDRITGERAPHLHVQVDRG